MLYLVVLTGQKTGNVVHSWHDSKQRAEEWAKCLTFGGPQAIVVTLDRETAKDIGATVETARKPEPAISEAS